MHRVVKLAPRELRFRVALGMLQMAAGKNDLAYRIMREVSRPQLASDSGRDVFFAARQPIFP